MAAAASPQWPPELLAPVSIVVRRGADSENAGRWELAGDRFRNGAFTLQITRGPHLDEPVLAEFGAECLSVERLKHGAMVMCAFTAEQIAQAQGPRRPITEILTYALCHAGERVLATNFIVIPVSACVDALGNSSARHPSSEN